jgi:hypothetical protein
VLIQPGSCEERDALNHLPDHHALNQEKIRVRGLEFRERVY